MSRPRLPWRIYAAFLLVTCAAYVATSWYAARSLRAFHQKEVAANLLAQAQLASQQLAATSLEPSDVDRYCKEAGRTTHTRFTVVLADGRVIADSEEDPSRMISHAERPEIIAALRGQTGLDTRFSATLRQRFLYLAIPLRTGDVVVGAMRASLPLTVVDRALAGLYRHLAVGALLVAALFALLALFLSHRLSRPLDEMQRAAGHFSAGDLTARVPVPAIHELAVLAQTLNQMAEQLDHRIRTITRQRNELTAVLTSMVEGVLAVDTREHVIEINPAAARLFDTTPDLARGLSLQECCRHPDLQQFVADALARDSASEGEIVLRGPVDNCLQLHGTPLADGEGRRLGSLIVLNDVSRLKKLETIRRDFVANVSHELKTPITTIRGYIETLANAAPADPAEQKRFLEVVSRHADRLQAIIDDLLSLSRIEFDVERGKIPLDVAHLDGLLRRVVQNFTPQARARRIDLQQECDPTLTAPMNATLLEQAIGNLVDNAVKYGDEGTPVTLTARRAEDVIEIRVADHGPGIERQHQDRIFERFYRVDQGRSRALGGTGLGLAIVRHIALAHRGTVAVDSTPGRGSTFILRIPAS